MKIPTPWKRAEVSLYVPLSASCAQMSQMTPAFTFDAEMPILHLEWRNLPFVDSNPVKRIYMRQKHKNIFNLLMQGMIVCYDVTEIL